VSDLHVIVEADGGSRGNPGPAGYGAVVFDAGTRAVLAERYESIGVQTNNVAEYRGLIAGLRAARELGATSVHVRMDSKLVIEQAAGRWQVKHPALKPLAGQASELLRGFADVSLEWIPRELNKHADRLANKAMDAAAARPAVVLAAGGPGPSTGWTAPVGRPTRLVLIRHGSTEHSVDRRYSGRNELPLSDLGSRQAAAIGRAAARFAVLPGAVSSESGFAALVSSPLRRARDTATAVADSLRLDIEIVEGLTEADFGSWEGLTAADVLERWPTEHEAWLASSAGAPPNGESFDEITRRVRRVRDEIIRRFPGQVVAVVTHMTPIKTLVRLALEAPLNSMFRIHLDLASISVIDYFENGVPSVRLVNDTGHLADL
jgi:broad specificity phosphatase PhoE/ribonuclease HI